MGVIKSFKKFIEESIWTDIQSRSAGDTKRIEDDVNHFKLNEFYEYIKDQYKTKVEYVDLDAMGDGNGDVLGVDITENVILFYKPKRGHILLSWSNVKIPMSFFEELTDRFNVKNPNPMRRIITEEDGSCTNQTFIDVIEFFLDHKQILLNESIWTDIQSRSAGDTVRKEDDVNLMDKDALYDYIMSTYGDMCISVNNLDEYILVKIVRGYELSLHYKNNKIDEILSDGFDFGDSSEFDTKFKIVKEEKSLYKIFNLDGTVTNKTALDFIEFYYKNVIGDKEFDLLKKLIKEFVNSSDEYSLDSFCDYIKTKKSLTVDNIMGRLIYFIKNNKDFYSDEINKVTKDINESIWTDIQSRSAGDTVRKEDEMTEKDKADLDKLITLYGNEVVYGRGMGGEACNLDDFCDYIETDNEIKDLNKSKVLKYVKDNWEDEVCDGVAGAIEQAELEYHQDMNESLWADIQSRSAGDTVRKEDEMTQADFDALNDCIFEFATRVVWDNWKYSRESFCKCINDYTGYSSTGEKANVDNILKYVNSHWAELNTELDDAIEREQNEKDEGMNESLWTDIQSRSTGDTKRKEDEILTPDDFLMLRETAKMFRNVLKRSANEPWSGTCDDFIKFINLRKKEHFWNDTPDEVYDKVIKFVKDKWGDCIDIQEFMDKYLSDIWVNECDGVPGGLTPANVGGMGAAYFPGPNGEPGSGDLPSPTGIVYHQVAPYTVFLKELKKKKKKKKFRIEDEPCAHSKNSKVYDYVDDYREYVDRTYNNMDKRK